MNRLRVLTALLVLLPGCGHSPRPAPAPDSGVRGRLLFGVVKGGEPGFMAGPSPSGGDILVARAANGDDQVRVENGEPGSIVQRVDVGGDGRFTIHLGPGLYVLIDSVRRHTISGADVYQHILDGMTEGAAAALERAILDR